jgi:hypothetical protein
MMLFLQALAHAALPAPAIASDEVTLVGPAFLDPVIELPPNVAELLAASNHAQAATALAAWPDNQVRGRVLATRSSCRAGRLSHSGQAAKALPFVETIGKAEHVPEPYKDLVVGECCSPETNRSRQWPRSRACPRTPRSGCARSSRSAEARQAAGATEESARDLERAGERVPIPRRGATSRLWSLAVRHGTDLAEGRAVSAPPLEPVPDEHAWDRAAGDRGERTPEERVTARAAVHGREPMGGRRRRGRHGSVRSDRERMPTRVREGALAPQAEPHERRDPGTVARRGEVSRHRRRRGAGALYLVGKALERGKDWPGARRRTSGSPSSTRKHSMADDGWRARRCGVAGRGRRRARREALDVAGRGVPDG